MIQRHARARVRGGLLVGVIDCNADAYANAYANACVNTDANTNGNAIISAGWGEHTTVPEERERRKGNGPGDEWLKSPNGARREVSPGASPIRKRSQR